MKFVCQANEVHDRLDKVKKLTDAKSHTLDILKCVVIETYKKEISLSTNTLTIATRETFSALENTEKGSIAVNAKQLRDVLKFLKKDVVVFESKNDKLLIKSNTKKIELKAQNIGDFPITQQPDNYTHSISSLDLYNHLDKVYSSASTEEVRYYLNSVLIEFDKDKIVSVGTDGRRLSFYETENDLNNEPLDVMIPLEAAICIRNFYTISQSEYISVSQNKGQLYLSDGIFNFQCRLHEGDYPDYKSLINYFNYTKRVIVNRNLLIELIKFGKQVPPINSAFVSIELTFAQKSIQLFVENEQEGIQVADLIPLQYKEQHEPATFKFDAHLLLSVLESISFNIIEIRFNELSKAVYIFTNDKEFTLLMPLANTVE